MAIFKFWTSKVFELLFSEVHIVAALYFYGKLKAKHKSSDDTVSDIYSQVYT